MTTFTPQFLWAQDKTHVFLSVNLSDAKIEKATMTETEFDFAASVKDKKYALKFTWHAPIVVDKSKYAQHRIIEFLLAKKDEKADHWPFVCKEKSQYKKHSKVDFDKWVDSDDEDEKPAVASGFGGGAGGGMDMSSLMSMMGKGGAGGMPGMGGMGGMPGMGGMGGMPGMGGMGGMPGMGGMGGMPGMGGAPAGPDSDDDDLPELEDEPADAADAAPADAAPADADKPKEAAPAAGDVSDKK